ncbi:MAG: hypothetical protein SP1CHLAM9_10120 [Chlamydiia bacterium]|nr:hypothetical protein [Chlamydiia bacterium]
MDAGNPLNAKDRLCTERVLSPPPQECPKPPERKIKKIFNPNLAFLGSNQATSNTDAVRARSLSPVTNQPQKGFDKNRYKKL